MTAVVRLLDWYVTLPSWAIVGVVAVVGIAVMGGIVGLQALYARIEAERTARRVVRNLARHRLAVGEWQRERELSEAQYAGYVRLYRAIRNGPEERP